MVLNLKSTKRDAVLANKIAHRASSLANEVGVEYTILEAEMDILATHLNGNPLKLSELAEAPDFDFAHDVFGIRQNINRTTGEIENCFSPLYSTTMTVKLTQENWSATHPYALGMVVRRYQIIQDDETCINGKRVVFALSIATLCQMS